MPLGLLEQTFAIGCAASSGFLLDFGVFPDIEGAFPDLENHFQNMKELSISNFCFGAPDPIEINVKSS